jgi:hypothetical protein
MVVDANGVSVADLLDRKQPTLVSGVNIKTINGKTLLGEGDLVIEGGGLKYFVERYVYEGKTEEEKTYNLESLAMAFDGVDILWAGMGGLQPNYEYGSMWGYMTTLDNYYGIFAKVDIDSETGALVRQTVEFIRDFYFAQGSEMKVLAANFFKIEGWAWQPAFYMARPILYWADGETDTMAKAYFLLDGLKTAYVSINIETGEVGSPVPVQSN